MKALLAMKINVDNRIRLTDAGRQVVCPLLNKVGVWGCLGLYITRKKKPRLIVFQRYPGSVGLTCCEAQGEVTISLYMLDRGK
jgi:hypothetical protein